MKKIKTILKQIDDLEKELFTNYNSREIAIEIEKMHKDANNYFGMSDGLLSVIYDGVYNDLELNEYIEDTYKDAFIAYEEVRKSGEYNMITDAFLAAEAAGLSMEQYKSVIKNYSVLKKQFSA